MEGEKIIEFALVTGSPDIIGACTSLYMVEGAIHDYVKVESAGYQLQPHDENRITAVGVANSSKKPLFLSATVVVDFPDGSKFVFDSEEQQVMAGESRMLTLEKSVYIGDIVGTYKCEMELYGHLLPTDEKQLLDTRVFYIYCYYVGDDKIKQPLEMCMYRKAATKNAFALVPWSPTPATIVAQRLWWVEAGMVAEVAEANTVAGRPVYATGEEPKTLFLSSGGFLSNIAFSPLGMSTMQLARGEVEETDRFGIEVAEITMATLFVYACKAELYVDGERVTQESAGFNKVATKAISLAIPTEGKDLLVALKCEHIPGSGMRYAACATVMGV